MARAHDRRVGRWLALAVGAGMVAALAATGRTGPTRAQTTPAARLFLPLVWRAADRAALPSAPTARPATAVPPTVAPTSPPPASPTAAPTDAPAATPTAGATATPTRGLLATEAPSATPLPTATPTASPTSDGRVCRELLTNGDFEKGPAEWDLESGFRARTLSQIIRKPEAGTIPRPTWGAYFAGLGGGADDVVESITHPGRPLRLLSTLQAARIISASLSLDFTMLTEEVPNRRPDDTLQPFFVNQDGVEEAVAGIVLSEESVPVNPPATWKRFSADVTRHVVVRPGWERFQLRIKSRMSATVPTWHFIDEIALIVCERGPMP